MSEYDFLVTKIHGKLASMLARDDIQTLENAGMEAIIQRLHNTNYGPALGEGAQTGASDNLRRGLFLDIENLFFSLQGDDRALLVDVLARYRVENLKTIIRAQVYHLPAEQAVEKIFHLPWERVDYKKWLSTGGLEALLQEIPWPRYRTKLQAVHRQVGDVVSTFNYEVALDNVYLEDLIGRYKAAGVGTKRTLQNRLLREILSWAFRLREYGYSFPEMINFLPDFRPLIPQDELRTIIEEGEGWRRMARFFSGELREEWEKAQEFDVGLSDLLFDRQLVGLVRRSFIISDPGIGSVIGYVYLKEIELSWLIEAIERTKVRN